MGASLPSVSYVDSHNSNLTGRVQVRVLFFAKGRELAGTREVELGIDAGVCGPRLRGCLPLLNLS